MKLSRILFACDSGCAILLTLVFAYWLPHWVPNDLAKDYLGIGVSVLSIVFSVFFAALAVIIAASDDEFVLFLEANGDYSALIANFKFSLGLLFLALIYSLGLYAYTAARISSAVVHQRRVFLVLFCLLFLWSLFAAFASTYDAIKYSDYRRRFVAARRK
jgi:hypothetical protein